MMTKKRLMLLTALLGCGLLVAQSSPKDVPAEPGPEEKITPMSIPNDPYVIDSEIKRLKALKQGLIGRAYIADEDAMRFEFEDWEDYQQELQNEERIKKRIARVQQKIDMLEAKKAQLKSKGKSKSST